MGKDKRGEDLKKFEVMHMGHHIRVENRWFSGEKLYIDDQLQDENIGIGLRASLTGELQEDKGKVKVNLGGNFKIKCNIFVDNKLIYPTPNY